MSGPSGAQAAKTQTQQECSLCSCRVMVLAFAQLWEGGSSLCSSQASLGVLQMLRTD